ncbi:MAG: IS66 family transposase [Planctomycetota bacterium]|nr:IS66 family transposase [Planctomycetota bacterium]
MINSANSLLEIPQRVVFSYETQDFQSLYEREYWAHQTTKHELKKALDRIAYLESKVAKLESDNAYIRKLLFARKTEISPKPAENTAPKEPKTHGAQPGHPAHLRKIPWHLSQQDIVHHIAPRDCFCPNCGLPFQELNTEDVSYEVTVDIRYILQKHRRKKYKKTCKCSHPIITAPGPVKLMPKGLYSADFWIQVLLDKYAYSMPLTRQIARMQLAGLNISNGVLNDGLSRLGPMLKPLYDLMMERIAFEKLVHADETGWWNWASCYYSERSEDKARQWLWGFFSSLYHIFVINPSRGAKVIKKTLGQGPAQTILSIIFCDRYRAYQTCGNTTAFCWAHVRRDFINLKTKYPQNKSLIIWADTWLSLISDLYLLNELRLKHLRDPPLYEAYQKQIESVLDKMKSLMNPEVYRTQVQLAQIKSMEHHWAGLTLFVSDPEIPLDNNLAERALRTPVVGRKNFYGNHSNRAAQGTAIFYSVIATCKLHKIDTKKFLKRYFMTCAQSETRTLSKEQAESFLPHKYILLHPEDKIQS